jgi:hypothetical protein
VPVEKKGVGELNMASVWGELVVGCIAAQVVFLRLIVLQ